MNCPSCAKALASANYEGSPLWHCPGCRGRLVEKKRLKAIREKRGRTTDELTGEAEGEMGAGSAGPVPCPKCAVPMSKEAGPGPVPFETDVCGACGLVWFDGGELALVQLACEAAKEDERSAELTRRLEDLSAGARRSFDDKLSALRDGLVPDGPDLGDYGFMISIL